MLPEDCLLRPCKYLNNVIEQDHRCVKRRVHPGLEFGTFATAQRAIQGYEAMHMLRKGQLEGNDQGRCPYTELGSSISLFGLAASQSVVQAFADNPSNFRNTNLIFLW